jgi:hypothetical protein
LRRRLIPKKYNVFEEKFDTKKMYLRRGLIPKNKLYLRRGLIPKK